MNISSNNVRGLSQADRCITGRSDWKKIVSVSNEAFDTSIIDQLDGTLGGVDFRA